MRKAGNGICRVAAHSRKLGQILGPAACSDEPSCTVQVECPPVVAEPLPLADHVAGLAAASASAVGQRSRKAR